MDNDRIASQASQKAHNSCVYHAMHDRSCCERCYVVVTCVSMVGYGLHGFYGFGGKVQNFIPKVIEYRNKPSGSVSSQPAGV